MPQVLHILSHPEAPLTREIIAEQCQLPDTRVVIMDLTVESPDYEELLVQIFAADSVAVW